MSILKVGFIGAGTVSTMHILGYQNNPKAKLAAICDVNRELALERAKAWGIPEGRVFTDHHQLLNLAELDMVEVLLPDYLHYPITMDAIAAGKHVSVQKPMAMNVSEADKMIAAARAKGVSLRIFEQFIFMPQMRRAKELVEAGEIGDLLTIRLKTIKATSPDCWKTLPDTWQKDASRRAGGDWLTDDGYHMYALAWYFMGLPEEVHTWRGETKLPSGDVIDIPSIVTWKLPGNRFGSWEVVRAKDMVINTDYYASDDQVEITGTKGLIWVLRGHGKLFDCPVVILYKDRKMHTFSDINTGWEQSFIKCTHHYIDALEKGVPALLTGEQGREITRWCTAVEKSADSGSSVRL